MQLQVLGLVVCGARAARGENCFACRAYSQFLIWKCFAGVWHRHRCRTELRRSLMFSARHLFSHSRPELHLCYSSVCQRRAPYGLHFGRRAGGAGSEMGMLLVERRVWRLCCSKATLRRRQRTTTAVGCGRSRYRVACLPVCAHSPLSSFGGATTGYCHGARRWSSDRRTYGNRRVISTATASW